MMKFSKNNTVVLSIIEDSGKVEISAIFDYSTNSFYKEVALSLLPDKEGNEYWDNHSFIEALVERLRTYPWYKKEEEFKLLTGTVHEQALYDFFVNNGIESPEKQKEFAIAILECWDEIKQLLI